MTTKLNPGKPDGGETLGTCDYSNGPGMNVHCPAEHMKFPENHPVPCANWKPLAPEATTKEKSDANARTVGLAGEFMGDVDSTSSRSMDSAPSKGFPVAPGEAVGRETREPGIAKAREWRQANWYDKVPEQLDEALYGYAADVVEDLESELSTLRRERDQLLARLGLSGRAE